MDTGDYLKNSTLGTTLVSDSVISFVFAEFMKRATCPVYVIDIVLLRLGLNFDLNGVMCSELADLHQRHGTSGTVDLDEVYSVITTRVCREIETARTENRTLKGSSSFHQLQAKTTSLGTALSTYITDLLLFGARSESDDPSDNEMDDKSGDDDDKAEDDDDKSVRGGDTLSLFLARGDDRFSDDELENPEPLGYDDVCPFEHPDPYNELLVYHPEDTEEGVPSSPPSSATLVLGSPPTVGTAELPTMIFGSLPPAPTGPLDVASGGEDPFPVASSFW